MGRRDPRTVQITTTPAPRRVRLDLTPHEAAALLRASNLVATDPDMRAPHGYLTPAQGAALDRAVRKLRTAAKEG